MPRRREGNRQEGAVRDDLQDDGDDTNDDLEADEKFNSQQNSLEGDAECAKYLKSSPHNSKSTKSLRTK